jgi:molybdopterin synthase catalytic subunit
VEAALFPEPIGGDRWLGVGDDVLPVDRVSAWVVEPRCGAAVTFVGTARDHSEGRPEVHRLAYEAYEEQVLVRFDRIVDEIRQRWPDAGRVALLHRTGEVPVTEAAVVVAVASPHRTDAFEAASFGIDTLKATAPIWKRETWRDGESWGLEPQHIVEVGGS